MRRDDEAGFRVAGRMRERVAGLAGDRADAELMAFAGELQQSVFHRGRG